MYNTEKENKIKAYINSYLGEIQRHFDVSDKKMRLILYELYKDKSLVFEINLFIKNTISMIKSFYKDLFRRLK